MERLDRKTDKNLDKETDKKSDRLIIAHHTNAYDNGISETVKHTMYKAITEELHKRTLITHSPVMTKLRT